MKLTIKSALSTAFLMILTLSAFAQRGGGDRTPEDVAEKQTQRMHEQLDLSATQLTSVKAINLKYAEKMSEARENAAGDRSAMRTIMQDLRTQKNAELQGVLTEAQYKELEALMAEKKDKRKGGRKKKS
jgi:hypothetical protein